MSELHRAEQEAAMSRRTGRDEVNELIHLLLRHLLERPASVHLEITENDSEILFQLRVPREEMGKLIGRNGRTARSLRIIFSAIGIKYGAHMRLDISERQGPFEIAPLENRTML